MSKLADLQGVWGKLTIYAPEIPEQVARVW